VTPDGAGAGAFDVAASLWSTPPADLDAEAARLTAAGLRRWHWDVSDGAFAAPGGFDPATVARLTAATGLPGEAHLMVTDPRPVLDAWADVCGTVIVHAEATGWREAVEHVRARGARAGVALSPGTPLDVLADLPPDVVVLVMAITPGQAGSTFLPGTPARLDALAGRHAGLGVDGGVTLDHARECARHGATWVVSGSALCTAPDPAAWLARARTS
jgi:ribulose-phosphate 3-epimerase